MAIEFKRTSYEGRVPVIWRGECKVFPAGFKPANTLNVGMVVLRGTPLCVDMDTLTAGVVKVATILDGGTTTKPRVGKGHYFAVGDVVMKVGKTDLTVTVSAIDKSNVDYDVITFSAALTTLTKGDVIAEAVAGDTATERYIPNAVVAADLEVKDKLDTLDAAYEALILKNAVPYPILNSWVVGLCLKNNPNIMFIKQ